MSRAEISFFIVFKNQFYSTYFSRWAVFFIVIQMLQKNNKCNTNYKKLVRIREYEILSDFLKCSKSVLLNFGTQIVISRILQKGRILILMIGFIKGFVNYQLYLKRPKNSTLFLLYYFLVFFTSLFNCAWFQGELVSFKIF